MGKIVGVLSLKGGVGKTSSVVALGWALSHFGKKVLLVDGNFSAPNLGIHLNVIAPQKTIHNVLREEAQIEEAIMNLDNFDILPASIFSDSDIDVSKFSRKLRHIKNKYDVILVDSSPSLNDETLAVMKASDELYVVTLPDYSSLSMALKSIKKAKDGGAPIKGIILNRVYGKNFEINLEDVEKTSEVPVMAVIPHDINIVKSQSYFVPSLHLNPKSVGSEEYKKLAALLIGEKYRPPFKIKNILNKVSPKKQELNREIYYYSIFE